MFGLATDVFGRTFPVHHLRLGLFQWFVGGVPHVKIAVDAAGGGDAAAVPIAGKMSAAAAFFGVQNVPHHTASSVLLFHLFVQKLNVAAHSLQQLGGWWLGQ